MSLLDLSSRSTEAELLDSWTFQGSDVVRAFSDIECFNRWLGGHRAVVRAIRRAVGWVPRRPLTIVDIGCGSGDTLRELAAWGTAHATALNLHGVDANPAVIEIARRQSSCLPSINYVVADAFGDILSELRPDIVLANQFFHHFASDELAAHLPRLMARTRVLVITDLHRHVLAHAGFAVLSRLLGASQVASHDGLVSIRRGFTRRELADLITPLRLSHWGVRWAFPFRYEAILVA